MICTGFISITRLGIRVFFSHLKGLISIKEAAAPKRIIIIGAGDSGQSISRQILHQQDKKLELIAVIDDSPKKIGQRLHGVHVLGPIEDLHNLNLNFEEIYICVPSANRHQMRAIVSACEKTKKPFKTLPSISELMEGKATISQFREVSILDLLGRKEVELDTSAIKNLVEGKRVLITGAGGSIGSELVRQSIKYKPSILILLDISELNLFEIERETEIVNTKVKILIKPILADIRDKFSVDQVYEEYKPQIILHAAAYKHVPIQEKFPWEAIKTNVIGTYNLANAAIKYKIEKFVLVSTDKAVKPVNVMGATKRIAEIIMQNLNLSQKDTAFMAVRFGNVLGSSGSVIPIFKDQIKNGGPVTITHPEMERYFMSIPEASQLILQAGALGKGGEIFILDMGNPIKIIDLASQLIRLSGYEPEVDIPIEITGMRPGEKKTEELSSQTENLDKTRHNKIFVLDENIEQIKAQEKVLHNIKNLKNELYDRNPTKIRNLLTSILNEYNPGLIKSEENRSIKINPEAEA